MKNGQALAALAGGYFLGRSHKTRVALALAGLAASRGLGARGGAQVPQLSKSPELNRLVKGLRGELASAGKAAAVATAGKRINALSDRLEGRVSALRGEPVEGRKPEEPEKQEAEEPEEAAEPEERERRAPRKKAASGGGGRGEGPGSRGAKSAKKESGSSGPQRRSRG